MPKKKNQSCEDDPKCATIKCALRSRCFNDEVFSAIQHDVRDMSDLAVEASRYIFFVLMSQFDQGQFPTEKFQFGQYFKALCHQPRTNYILDNDFVYWRGNRALYAIPQHRSNILVHLIKQYDTAFRNNLKMHAWKRIQRFFAKFTYQNDDDETVHYKYADMKNTLAYLFYRNTDVEPNEILLGYLREHLGWINDGQHLLFDIDSDEYYKHIELFYRLQRYNEDNRHKNFRLIPQFKFGALHIQYDTQSMFHLLNSLKLLKDAPEGTVKTKNTKRDYYQRNREAMWKIAFKPPKGTESKEFDFSIATDGVAVSFKMHHKNKTTGQICGDGQAIGNLTEIKRKLDNEEYDVCTGIDPGRKLLLGGIVQEKNANGVWPERNVKISSASYHNRSGFPSRYRKRMKWTTPEQLLSSSKSQHFDQYIDDQLRIFYASQEKCCARKVTRLKFKKYICVQATCAKMVKELIGGSKNALIVIGSTAIPANSPIKGYRRTPNSKVLREMKRQADVLQVDEFRTTKLCANCYHACNVSRSPHRFLFCPNCKTHWHRDINAGVNKLYKGNCLIYGNPFDINFYRTTRLD